MKLETCNRVEFYVVLSGEDVGLADEFLPSARVLYDYEAVRHLLRVLLGLESMARGESHIVSQLKSAYGEACGCGKVLHKLMQRALGMAASLRGEHPGREPSLSRIASEHYLNNSPNPGRPVMVVGMGEIGRDTAHILLLSGCDVLAANRTRRDFGEKLASVKPVPWESWRERARDCGAIFLCTASSVPILSAADARAMPDVWVFDLGSPHQSEPVGSGVRVTLDEMREIAEGLLEDYGKSLASLEIEADKASGALLAEISILTDDTWKHLALSRAHSIIKDRASQYAGKCGAAADELELFASSVMKAFLHPLVSARAGHGTRAWRILSGEGEECAEE
jgi:glutamyl-tRNA reductase